MLELRVAGGGAQADRGDRQRQPRLPQHGANAHGLTSLDRQSRAGPTMAGSARLRPTIIHGLRLVSADRVAARTAKPSSPTARAAPAEALNLSLVIFASRADRTSDRVPAARIPTKRSNPGMPSSTSDSR